MNIFQRLGITADADERSIKRAYAALIKQYRPETHPQEFAEIRDAYEEALYLSRNQPPDETESDDGDATANVATAPVTPEYIQYIQYVASEDERALQPPSPADSNIIAQMMRELSGSVAQLDEDALLALYQQQQEKIASLPIDLQLDYEEALRYGLLFTDRPPLQVLLEADKRYRWSEHSMEIVNLYGAAAGARFDATRKLAETYMAALRDKPAFVRLEGKPLSRNWLVSNHYRTGRAQELALNWQQQCQSAELPGYLNRLTAAVPQFIVYWVDIAISVIVAGMFWLLAAHQNETAAILDTLITAVLILLAPAVTRFVAPYAYRKPFEKIAVVLQKLRINADGKWTRSLFLLLMLTLDGLPIAFLLQDRLADVFFLALGMAVVFFMLTGLYGIFASFETSICHFSTWMVRYFRRIVLREPQFEADGKTPLRWNSEFRQWRANRKKTIQTGNRASYYWWIVIWVALLQVARMLTRN